MNEGRHLIVCCDGTNNIWGHGDDVSNVVKLFKHLKVDAHQVLYYDPGVGTAESNIQESENLRAKFGRMAGLAWGNGAWKNVAEAYAWLMRHYQNGDRIYLIGFSRGAFTVRALAGILHWFQLIRPENEAMIPSLIRAYRTRDDAKRRDAARSIRKHFSRCPNWEHEGFPIEAIAVFDTVESVGFNQILMGTQVHSDNLLKPDVRFARHAVALDETRWAYEPRLYVGVQDKDGQQNANIDGVERLKQVAFTGAHCDVGGCYSETGLSDLALAWMIEELECLPPESALEFQPDWIDDLHPDPLGPRHDEILNMPLWALTGRVRRRFLHPRQESTTFRTLLLDRDRGPLQDLRMHRAVIERWQQTNWQPPIQPLAKDDRSIEEYGPKLRARLTTLQATRKAPMPAELADSTARTTSWLLKSILAFIAFSTWYFQKSLLASTIDLSQSGNQTLASFGNILNAFTPEPTPGLQLLLDTILMIPICVVLLTSLQVLAFGSEQKTRFFGIWGCRLIGAYALADIAENVLKAIVINLVDGADPNLLFLGFEHGTWNWVLEWLIWLACQAKITTFLLAFCLPLAALPVAWYWRRQRRKHQPWQQLQL
ncbi:hypothetical protein C7S18_20415 [Ahniella affigens]|uniref:T6SS Phospholipase effector Tle1-like catalytic domain-containing protein n=1 Tax=Ahniella affigens TaxID=2021234 RepID=A0A2P1PX15_9GAMM|nr:DUF2235 domain-containing protein [Ahniella affigens]AVP99389.1 hypothetical protein C7S18_20415 [Ahniella affigens]